jgi:hypothetical protein
MIPPLIIHRLLYHSIVLREAIWEPNWVNPDSTAVRRHHRKRTNLPIIPYEVIYVAIPRDSHQYIGIHTILIRLIGSLGFLPYYVSQRYVLRYVVKPTIINNDISQPKIDK